MDLIFILMSTTIQLVVWVGLACSWMILALAVHGKLQGYPAAIAGVVFEMAVAVHGKILVGVGVGVKSLTITFQTLLLAHYRP